MGRRVTVLQSQTNGLEQTGALEQAAPKGCSAPVQKPPLKGGFMDVEARVEQPERHRRCGMAEHPAHQLVQRVARLSPCRRNPDRFFEERSEIVAALHRLANGGGKP